MCAYCRELFPENETTEDHVPPQGVFGKKRPPNMELLKVNACRTCHKNTSLGDECLKAIAGLGAIRDPAAAQVASEVEERLKIPSFWRNRFRDALIERGEVAPLILEGGIEAHPVPMPPEVWTQIEATIRRTAIGILFDRDPAWNSRVFDLDVSLVAEDRLSQIRDSLGKIGPFQNYTIIGGGAFVAGWGFSTDRSNWGVMFMNFYGGLSFFVFIRPQGQVWPV